MQDVWREYLGLFCRGLTSGLGHFSPCAAFWPGDVRFSEWQAALRQLQLDRTSRRTMLGMLFAHVELRCGQPHERLALEAFRASPFLCHGRQTKTVSVFVDYVYDPWIVGSILYDYPNVEEIRIVIEAPLERRDRDDLMMFVRQVCQMGRKVSLTPAWTHWQARHRSELVNIDQANWQRWSDFTLHDLV